jgi:hypothetical protein
MTIYDEAFYRSIGDEGVVTANEVVPLVVGLLGPIERVLDLGCGVGSWLSVFKEHGARHVHGVDGEYVPREQLRIRPDEFEPADLSAGYLATKPYDLAMSLEVAEHLPATSATNFVGSLTAAAPAVLFSAAIPGQGGTGHVNEQWPDYWAALFAEQGYLPIDVVRPAIWSTPGVSSCIAQNTLLYVRASIIEHSPALTEARAATRDQQLSLVHPRRYSLLADPAQASIKRMLRDIPAAAYSSTVRKVRGTGRATNH